MEDTKKADLVGKRQRQIWMFASLIFLVIVLVSWLKYDSWNMHQFSMLLFFAITNYHIADNGLRRRKEMEELREALRAERDSITTE